MADNFLQSSFVIENVTKEESAWLERVFASLALFEADDVDSDTQAFLKDLFQARDLADLTWGWTLNMDVNDACIFCEESGDPDAMSTVLQRFLLRFRPDQYITFTWAETCSKPRVDEFGGGAALVTSHSSEWMHAHDWVQDKQAEYDGVG